MACKIYFLGSANRGLYLSIVEQLFWRELEVLHLLICLDHSVSLALLASLRDMHRKIGGR